MNLDEQIRTKNFRIAVIAHLRSINESLEKIIERMEREFKELWGKD